MRPCVPGSVPASPLTIEVEANSVSATGLSVSPRSRSSIGSNSSSGVRQLEYDCVAPKLNPSIATQSTNASPG